MIHQMRLSVVVALGTFPTDSCESPEGSRIEPLFLQTAFWNTKIRNFPEPSTPGIFSKVTPVQMGGVLRYKREVLQYKWEVYRGVSLSSRLGSQQCTALQMGGVLRYKLEVYCQYFSDKLYGLGVPE